MTTRLRILSIGLSDVCGREVAETVSEQEIVVQPCDLDRVSEEVLEPAPALLFCGPPQEGVTMNELAQGLRLCYPSTAIYFITSVREGFDRKSLVKNGFSDAFLLPAERIYFSQIIQNILTELTNGEFKSYRTVRLVDVTPGTSLPFDTFIYMPANKKYLKISNKGDTLDSERAERLGKYQFGSLHVSSDQLQDFYRFSAEQLRKLGADGQIGETERREKMKSAVRDLMSQMFDDATKNSSTSNGKHLVQDCQEIVKCFILSDQNKTNSWYERIISAIDTSSGSYSHATNVATLAALFSIGTGIGKPEELAMAGILHDIGLVDLPHEIQTKPHEQLTLEEVKTYQGHVELSLNIIRNRKLVVSDTVLKAIEMHHERQDGTGFPKGRSFVARTFIPEAQILALATEFDRLTALEEGKKQLTAIEAITQIKHESLTNPGSPKFEPSILNRVADLFPAQKG